MKPLKRIQVPFVDVPEVKSPELKGVMKAFQAIIDRLVDQINNVLLNLLGSLNPNVAIWGAGSILEMQFDADAGDNHQSQKVFRHKLGSVPEHCVILDITLRRTLSTAGSPFSGSVDPPMFTRSPYPDHKWTEDVIIVWPNETATTFGACFTVWLLP